MTVVSIAASRLGKVVSIEISLRAGRVLASSSFLRALRRHLRHPLTMVRLALVAALLVVGVNGFTMPSHMYLPCAHTTCQRVATPEMIDSDVVIGTVGLIGGTALGAGFIAFVEKQGEKSAESMSEETRSRMAGKFMEDEELVVNYDDTIAQMEIALAKAEGRDVIEGDGLSDKEKDGIDTRGWGD